MIQVTSREFRSNQASFFDKADAGEEVIIRRRGKKSYLLLPIEDDGLELSPEAQAKVAEAQAEYRRGEYTRVADEAELERFLDSL